MSAIDGLEKCVVSNSKITLHFSSEEKAGKFAGILFPYCGNGEYSLIENWFTLPRRLNKEVSVGVELGKGTTALEKIGTLFKSTRK